MESPTIQDGYPSPGMLPKHETQAHAFVTANPTFDGRGTIVAILDTGVDPGAAGLITTSDGKRKVIDIVDCTNAGDVEMHQTTITSYDNYCIQIKGANGEPISVPTSFVNPTNTWRVGTKRAYDLWPSPLVTRMKKSRKNRFAIEHAALLAKAQGSKDPAELEILKDLYKTYDDAGPTYNVVSWHDGQHWRVAVDTLESGNLTGQPALTDYSVEYQHHTFGEEDLCNFSVNIYDDGDIVSLVTVVGSHGTHVAGITAAYYPEEPSMNGVAPGAQIVSLKIGDSRLGSMETGSGLVRAAIHMAKHKPHVANMSYGESTSNPNVGRFIELLRDDVINRAGVVFVSSAGNAGPGLQTVGAPGGTTTGAIGVGAYVNTSMMVAEYSLLENVPPRPFTWSSRGPTADGDAGVNIYAPGAAVTAVPTYTLQPNQQMNGTSMSSPNACGSIALLISGLLQSNKSYSPYTIKHAVENSSVMIQAESPQDMTHGAGFIQVQRAWDWLMNLSDANNKDGKWNLLYDVSLPETNQRGIYLRDHLSTGRVLQTNISVTPRFPRQDDPETNKLKLGLDLRIQLVPSHDWVRAPEYAHVNNGGKTFALRVDPTKLEAGLVHVAWVDGMDATQPDHSMGPLFRIPITICKPLELNSPKHTWKDVKFGPGHIHRRFVQVPLGATICEATLTSLGRPTPARFMLQCIQTAPQTRNGKLEQDYNFLLGSAAVDCPSIVNKTFRVAPGETMEFCLAQFWSSSSETMIDIDLTFHGLVVSANAAHGTSQAGILGVGSNVSGGVVLDTISRLDVTAPLQRENLQPSLVLDTLRKTILPTSNQTRALTDRDRLPDSRICFAFELTYEFKLGDASTVTLRLPWMDDLLYESPFEHFLLQLFDANKRLVQVRDVYPKAIKLEKGEYVVKAHIVTSQPECLEKWTSAPLVVDAKMKDITASLFQSISDLYANKTGFGEKTLQHGERRATFVGQIEPPKDAQAGDVLVGEVKMYGGKVDGGQGSIFYPVHATKDATKPSKADSTKTLSESIRDLEITYLKTIKKEDERQELLKKLEQAHGDFLPLLVAKMEMAVLEARGDGPSLKPTDEKQESSLEVKQTLEEITEPGPQAMQETTTETPTNGLEVSVEASEAKEPEEAPPEKWQNVIAQADAVIQAAGGPDVVLFFASKNSDAQKKKEMDARKEALLTAIYNKMDAVRHLKFKGKEFDDVWEEYQRWAWLDSSTNEWKQVQNQVYSDKTAGKWGSALKVLLKYLGDPAVGDANRGHVKRAEEEKLDLVKQLGWDVWYNHFKLVSKQRYPSAYARF
jgi:tripeptidyl-peptidase-2